MTQTWLNDQFADFVLTFNLFNIDRIMQEPWSFHNLPAMYITKLFWYTSLHNFGVESPIVKKKTRVLSQTLYSKAFQSLNWRLSAKLQ